MQSNKTVFRVFSYGGKYDDAWERTEGICEDPEIAEKLRIEVSSYYDIENCAITQDQYYKLLDALCEYEENNDEELPDDTVEAILYLFPDKYSKEEIERAEILYGGPSDFIGVDIEEVKFYDINS